MALSLTTRSAPVRAAARRIAQHHVPLRSYDENAAILALGATLVATLGLVLCAIALRG